MSDLKPSREEIEEAIQKTDLWIEELDKNRGLHFMAVRLRTLVEAARWALEIMDLSDEMFGETKEKKDE